MLTTSAIPIATPSSTSRPACSITPTPAGTKSSDRWRASPSPATASGRSASTSRPPRSRSAMSSRPMPATGPGTLAPVAQTSASPAHWNTRSQVRPVSSGLNRSLRSRQCSFTRGSTPPERTAADGVEHDAHDAVDRDLVQLVERRVHPARDEALDEQVAADQPAHQRADGGQLAQRHERAVVAEAEARQRPAVQARAHRAHEQRRLLVRDLRARRHDRARDTGLGPRTGRAVAEREDVRVARRRERRRDDEPVRAIGLEPVDRREPGRRADAGRPDHEVRGIARAARGAHRFARHVDHALADVHVDVEVDEERGGGGRDRARAAAEGCAARPRRWSARGRARGSRCSRP